MGRFGYLCVLALLPFSSVGCAVLGTSINVPITSETVIERGSVVEQIAGSLVFDGFKGLDVSQSQEFKNSSAQKNLITSARVKSLRLTILDPQKETFDFLHEIAFFVEAPGQSKQRIAHAKVPRGVNTFELAIDDLELAPYVKAESMSITSTVNGRRPDNDTTVRARLVIGLQTGLGLQ